MALLENNIDINNPNFNNSMDLIGLKMIFEELMKGNASVLTTEVNMELSNKALQLIQQDHHSDSEIDQMKYLLMICNILYNRTDMLVLPVEDGVYDLLLESYKKYDPNFQVGSKVIDFKDHFQKENPDIKQTIQPIFYYDKIERNEVRQLCYDRLKSFDNQLDYRDFIVNPIIYTTEYITKREHNTKHNHPDLVGTLDKCKFVTIKEAEELGVDQDPNVKILERDFFQKHIQQGIISPNQELYMVLELKYDGISVEADCNHEVESARSRGDMEIGEASDMTPILKGYTFHHNNLILDETIGVKFEAIMTRHNLEKFNKERGYNYANCRTAIIGLFGSSDANQYRDYITLIPLAVDRTQVPYISDRIEEIEFCNKLFISDGEPLRYMVIHGNYQQLLYQIKQFTDEAFVFRDYVNFMFDGIVVSYLDEGIRSKLGRENYINKYSMAVKFNPLSKLTTFLGYTFEVGQDGRIVPMFHYQPVEFFGTIHTKSSGASFARFKECNLKTGDIINVKYVNDVMPYVSPIDCEQNRRNNNPVWEFPSVCPVCGSPVLISDSGKTASCTNLNCDARVISRISNMLQKMNIKGFAESTVSSLNIRSFTDLMNLDYDFSVNTIGPGNTANLFEAINSIKSSGLPDYIIMGSLGFSGIASQKWKTIFNHISLRDLVQAIQNNPEELFSTLCAIPGIAENSARIILEEYPYYRKDIDYILSNINFIDSKNKSGSNSKQIRFSGCRNLQLQEQLNNLGYDCDGKANVTRNTDILLVPYQGYTSNKTSKVGPNCLIVPITEFINNMQIYL